MIGQPAKEKMRENKDSSLITYTSLAISFIAIVVITGWITGTESLLTIFPGLPTMKFNTALGFFFAGLALTFLDAFRKGFNLPVQLFSISTMLIGLLTLSQYAFGYSFGIDEFFFVDNISRAVNLPYPGRMSAATATCFLLLGTSLLIFSSSRVRLFALAQYILHLVSLISFISLMGFFYQVPSSAKLPFFSTMAIHTSITFLLISLAASLSRPHLGLVGEATLAANWHSCDSPGLFNDSFQEVRHRIRGIRHFTANNLLSGNLPGFNTENGFHSQ
jgi:hypothetical protein